MPRLLCAALLAAALAALGCNAGPPTGIVHGEVRLDGVPLPDGNIAFFSVDDSQPPAGGPIQAGRFRVTVPAGKVRLKVHSVEVVRPARLPDDEGYARERVPAHYNSRSTLVYEVQPGDNPVTFELTTRP